ncbi:hypothetical protein [Algicola sagamiensis]|uniref:hypothetical protein n=1 Tax=Algicola sagamiensis TaxID=163869 RepID=UPI00036C1748|nr:hypothetical protein [Algicola sagamiensis]
MQCIKGLIVLTSTILVGCNSTQTTLYEVDHTAVNQSEKQISKSFAPMNVIWVNPPYKLKKAQSVKQ